MGPDPKASRRKEEIRRRAAPPIRDEKAWREARRRSEWIGGLGDYLSKFHWQAYATPTFRCEVTQRAAKELVESWLSDLAPEVYAYIAYERGELGGRTHCHVLLGGLFGAVEKGAARLRYLSLSTKRAGRRWKCGNIKIDVYDPRRGAAWYVAKFPEEGEFFRTPRRQRRNRRPGSRESSSERTEALGVGTHNE